VKAKVTAGFAAATVGLLIDLTTIGASETPAAVRIGSAGLIAIGILLASAGMLQLRRAVDRTRRGARRGLAMQSLGLIGLLLAALALQISSSIQVLFVSAAFVVLAGSLAIVGGLQLGNHYADIGTTSRTDAGYLVLGTALMFLGVGVIIGSEIAYYFVLSDVVSTVVSDAGVAVSACGCVVAAYASFVMRGSSRGINLLSPVSQSALQRRMRRSA
jgi:uncharacterized membrane protein YidH (DUF202 family)